MAVSIALVAGAVAAVGSSVTQGVQGAHAKKTADNTNALQRFEQDQLIRRNEDEKKRVEATEVRDRNRAALAQRMASSYATAKGGTVVTSPIGLPGAPAVSGKSAIGG